MISKGICLLTIWGMALFAMFHLMRLAMLKVLTFLANDAQNFVKIAEGPDGALYYSDLVGNRVGRWELV